MKNSKRIILPALLCIVMGQCIMLSGCATAKGSGMQQSQGALGVASMRYVDKAAAKDTAKSTFEAALQVRIDSILAELGQGEMEGFLKILSIERQANQIVQRLNATDQQKQILQNSMISVLEENARKEFAVLKNAQLMSVQRLYHDQNGDTISFIIRAVTAKDNYEYYAWTFVQGASAIYDIHDFNTGVSMGESAIATNIILADLLQQQVNAQSNQLNQSSQSSMSKGPSVNAAERKADSLNNVLQKNILLMRQLVRNEDYNALARWYIAQNAQTQQNSVYRTYVLNELEEMSIYFQEKIVKIIHNHPDAQVRFSFLFARVASKQEDWQSSVEWMQKFGDVTGHDGGVYLLIARSLYNNNQSKKAIPYMGIALQKEKRNSQTWYELLDLLAAAKEWELLAQALPITEYWLGVEFDHEYLKGLKSWKGFFESQAYKEMSAGGIKQ